MEYNPKKYIPDPDNPERTCPVCDWDQADTDEMLEMHLLSNHEPEELIHAMKILIRNYWRMELAIRQECGIQGHELVQKHMSTRVP